jgi:putative glycerophosphodiester phosphodiesterase
MVAATAVFAASCEKDNWPDQPDWSIITPPYQPTVPSEQPSECDNIVVAHRGGSSECGQPDNSIASLTYAMENGCYGSECDIYWTKDDNVIVAHADSNCRINGYHPWEATLDEIRKAGNLTNGEPIPTLEEYIDKVMEKKSDGTTYCTRLWLDIKNITVPSTLTQYPIAATQRACEIIVEKKAQKFVEFICTGNATVMAAAFSAANAAGIDIGWMANRPVSDYTSRGYKWANISVDYMNDGTHTGARTIREFTDKGVAFSVYGINTDTDMNYYASQSSNLKGISSDYPRKLLGKMVK